MERVGVELWRATIIIPYVSADHILLLGGGLVLRSFNGGGDARAISEGEWCLKFDRLTEWPVGWFGVWLSDWLTGWSKA